MRAGYHYWTNRNWLYIRSRPIRWCGVRTIYLALASAHPQAASGSFRYNSASRPKEQWASVQFPVTEYGGIRGLTKDDEFADKMAG